MDIKQNKGEIIIYQTEDGQTSLEVNLVEDTVWLSLNNMVALFDRDKSVISRHIKNIFREGELDKRSVVAKYATTASVGRKERSYRFYTEEERTGFRINDYEIFAFTGC